MGEFDGVHLGHRAVIGDADAVLTFEPHPRAVVAPDAAPKLLTPLPVKADLLQGMEVKELVVIPFDGAFASQSAQEFIDDVLIGKLGATEVRVGESFRFGHRAQVTSRLLRGPVRLHPTVAEMVEVDGEIVSSTHIRGLIVAGDVERARASSGCPTTCAASSSTATRAAARSASRPPTSSPTTASATRGTAARVRGGARDRRRVAALARGRRRSACARRSSPAAAC